MPPSSMRQVSRWLRVAVLLLLPPGAFATDGRVEINQSTVLAAGGFPFRIVNPGSYVLTGNLDVTPGATGILILAHDVSLDLNGFAIRGTYVCDQTSCPFGAGRGIDTGNAPAGGTASRTRLVDGSVRGFGLECLKLGPDARVAGVAVSSCGDTCMLLGSRALVLENHVSFCGVFGLRLTDPSTYAHNVIVLADLGISPGAAVSGGTSGGGNVCDGGACVGEPGRRRRFYLTIGIFNGANADNPNNCAEGYHFASLFEIFDPSNLEYESSLGQTRADSGEGPPSSGPGWARTGVGGAVAGAPGQVNCNVWSSPLSGDFGTLVTLPNDWEGVLAPAENVLPWVTGDIPCNTSHPIWCVED